MKRYLVAYNYSVTRRDGSKSPGAGRTYLELDGTITWSDIEIIEEHLTGAARDVVVVTGFFELGPEDK